MVERGTAKINTNSKNLNGNSWHYKNKIKVKKYKFY